MAANQLKKITDFIKNNMKLVRKFMTVPGTIYNIFCLGFNIIIIFLMLGVEFNYC